MAKAIRVYRVVVVGCPRAIISPDGFYEGSGKSCFCNRFVRPEAYTEEHQQKCSEISEEEWKNNSVFNGDHFVYWGATTKHLPDKTKVRFQVVEQTEFYKKPAAPESDDSESDEESKPTSKRTPAEYDSRLNAHHSEEDYICRASSLHFRSCNPGKMAYRLNAMDEAVRRTGGPIRAATQLFPNEDFGGKKSVGVYGFMCIFDPTLEGDQMQKQLNFLSELLPVLVKMKRKVVIVCVKCDTVEDNKIRFGSKLSSYALKKTIPFFEVSSRDSVNVESAFFSLIIAPKKNKNNHRSGSGYLSYREVVDSRKGDLNRAKDTFRKFLQQTVNDFSLTWSEVLPLMRADYTYQSLKQLAGSEADETIFKMFQLRLIEIKLMESKQYGSLAKKADKEKAKQYQLYLKEAFNGHPDLSTYSYKEYLPDLSESDETSSANFTEPSTPSSYCPTPEIHDISKHFARMRSNTAPELPDPNSQRGSMSFQGNNSFETINTLPTTKKGSFPMEAKHLTTTSSSLPVDDDPPPLPARDSGSAEGQKEKRASKSSFGEKRKLSNSTDCLFLPDEQDNQPKKSTSYDRLDAEPYLQPMQLKLVLAHSSEQKVAKPSPPKDNNRNNAAFFSMRVPKKSRKAREMLSESGLLDGKDEKSERASSLERKTHKRSSSNPLILENMIDGGPPQLSSRQMENLPPTPSVVTPSHVSTSVINPIESSLEFTSPVPTDATRRLSEKPLPPLPKDSISPKLAKLHTSESVGDGDNLSQISGPFEEIDDAEQKRMLKIKSSLSLPDVSISSVRGSIQIGDEGSTRHSSDSNEEEEDDQYAQIEDFQQYMLMGPAPVDKSKTYPSEADGVGSPGRKSHSKTVASGTIPQGSTLKRDNSSIISPLSSLKRRLKKSPLPRESKEGLPPPLPPHSITTPNLATVHASTFRKTSAVSIKSPSHIHDSRPLPPSPTKGQANVSRKISSGSNIYEVIDEEFVSRVRNRPSRHGSRRDRELLNDLAPPVKRSLWPQYIQAVQTFFSLPQIQAHWVETVKAVMKDVDPDEICHPYSKLRGETRSMMESDIKEETEEERQSALMEKTTATKVRIHATPVHPSQPANEGRIPINLHQPITSEQTKSPVSQKRIAEQSPNISTSARGNLQQSAGSDELILMMNQIQHYNSSSESDSDEEDFDSDASNFGFDFDINLDIPLNLSSSQEPTSTEPSSTEPSSDSLPQNAPQEKNSSENIPAESATQTTSKENKPLPQTKPKPRVKPKPIQVPPQTDLDIAMVGLRASVSNDSDLVSTDSALTKSPHSHNNSAGEFEMDRLTSTSENEGVEIFHCVKPSQVIKKRATFRQTSKGEQVDRTRLDSGTFDEVAPSSADR